MDIDVKNITVRPRGEIVRDIISGAADQAKTERLIKELEARDFVNIAMNPETQPFPYMKFKSHIDAIMAFLADWKRPADEDKIIDSLLEGGYLKGEDRADGYFNGRKGAMARIRKSIGIYVAASQGERKRSGKMPGKIKQAGPNGLIGLYEWPDSMFD